MASDKKTLTLHTNEEQLAAIKALYEQNGWPFEECSIDEPVQCTSNSSAEKSECEWRPVGKPEPRGEKCPHCLCDPCIAHEANRQSWWLAGQHPPRTGNSSGRKQLYKRFWSMLTERGLWMSETYTIRKNEALRRDPQQNTYVWYHRREIMPNCVLQLVRGWLPNHPKTPYMGHMWE